MLKLQVRLCHVLLRSTEAPRCPWEACGGFGVRHQRPTAITGREMRRGLIAMAIEAAPCKSVLQNHSDN